jgi:hypothetical protein
VSRHYRHHYLSRHYPPLPRITRHYHLFAITARHYPYQRHYHHRNSYFSLRRRVNREATPIATNPIPSISSVDGSGTGETLQFDAESTPLPYETLSSDPLGKFEGVS